ncbi:MAG: radical SAM protein [Candidatus Riflebacteria bacterium]|nr:radical SAM protein [Candidatus Riflebacteria bacterium]
MAQLMAWIQRLRVACRYFFHQGGWHLLTRPGIVYNYWLARRQARQHRVEVSYQPSHVEIELSNRCNLACVQCLRATGKIGEEGGMSLVTFQRVLEQFPCVVTVALNGFGEVFLNKEFLPIVRWINASRPWVRVVITTNGTFFTPRMVEELLSVRVARLDVSLDAASPQTYLAIRRAPQFDRIVEGVRLLLEERRRRGMHHPTVGFNFIILDKNLDEVPAMVQLAHDVGVDRITAIRGEFSPWGYSNQQLRPRHEVVAILDSAQRLADRLNVQILENILCQTDHVDDFLPGLRRFNGYCDSFWNNIRLDYQGNVMLCCFSPLASDFSYGSVLEKGWDAIWNGPIFLDARQKANAGTFVAKACATCRPVLPIARPDPDPMT